MTAPVPAGTAGSVSEWGRSLADGAPGMALPHIERARAGTAGWEPVHHLAAAMTREPVPAHPEISNLFRGAPAVAYALHLAGHPAGHPAYRTALATLDHNIDNRAAGSPPPRNGTRWASQRGRAAAACAGLLRPARWWAAVGSILTRRPGSASGVGVYFFLPLFLPLSFWVFLSFFAMTSSYWLSGDNGALSAATTDPRAHRALTGRSLSVHDPSGT